MRKILLTLALALLFVPQTAQMQVFNQNQMAIPPFVNGGILYATSSAGNAKFTVISTSTLYALLGITSSGGGTIGTSTTPILGQLAYWTSLNTLGTVATGTLTTNATGLQFDNTRGVVGGSALLSIASGYTIPLTASTTEWSAAYASSTALTPAYIRGLWSETVTGLTYNSGTGVLSLDGTHTIPLIASTTEWATAYASTTALTPAYIRNLFSGTSPITYNTGTGAIGFDFSTNNTWTERNIFGNASSTNFTILNNLYLTGMANGCLQVTSGIATSTGVNCGSGGGGSNWTVEAAGLRTSTTTNYAKASYFIATSTTATSTFARMIKIGDNLIREHNLDFLDFQREVTDGDYTLLRIRAPMTSDATPSAEATLSLVNDISGDNSGVNEEFVDFYNEAYSDSRQWGLRQAYSGTGVAKPFVIGHWGTAGAKDIGNKFIITPGGTVAVARATSTIPNGVPFYVASSSAATLARFDTTPGTLAHSFGSSGAHALRGTSGTLTIDPNTDATQYNIGVDTTGTLSFFGSAAQTLNLRLFDGTLTLSPLSDGCLFTSSDVVTSTNAPCGNATWTIGNGLIYNATSTDRVGIGTTTPVSKLSVSGTAGSTNNILTVASSSHIPFLTVAANASTTLSSLATASCDVLATALGELYCGTNGGGSSLWTDGGSFTYLTDVTEDLVIGSSSTSTAPFYFDVAPTPTLTVGTTSGNPVVNIGTTTGISRLTVQGIDNSTISVYHFPVSQAQCNASDTFIAFNGATTTIGSIACGGTPGTLVYNTFTGSHYTKLLGIKPFINALLKSTGEVNETIQKVTNTDLLCERRSKAVYGVYGGTNENTGIDTVIGLGTGHIWVTNTGENLETGDLLMSSNRCGYAEIQKAKYPWWSGPLAKYEHIDDVIRNVTAAKVMEPIIWEEGETERMIAVVHLGG